MWIQDQIKPITAIANKGDELHAYYKTRTSDDEFVEIEGTFEYRGNRIHELMCSFPTGDYIIKVENTTRSVDTHIPLEVKEFQGDLYSRNTNNKVSTILKKLIKKGY